MKESQYYRGYSHFKNCVSAWFAVLFFVGLAVVSGLIWNNNRLWGDENKDIRIAQANNDFWAMVSGQLSIQDNVYGNFASDLYEFTQKDAPSDGLVEVTTDTINTQQTTPGYNPLVVDSLDEFVAPIDLYDGFEEATGINAFAGVDVSEDSIRDAGRLKSSFVDNVNQVVSGDSTGLLEQSTSHKYTYYSWNIWRELAGLYLLVGVIALLLGGVHFRCDDYYCNKPHYTMYGWSKPAHHTGAKIWLAILCPIMFVLWLALRLVSWPFRVLINWINNQYDIIQGRVKIKKQGDSLQISTTKLIDDLSLYRDNIVQLQPQSEQEIYLEEINRLIETLKANQPQSL